MCFMNIYIFAYKIALFFFIEFDFSEFTLEESLRSST